MAAATLSMSACGSTEEPTVSETESTVEASVEESSTVESSDPVVEPATYEVYIASVTDEEALGYTEDGTLYIFDITGLDEETKALFVEDAVLEVTDDGAELVETTYAVDSENLDAYVATATVAESVDETRAAEVRVALYAAQNGYTIEEQEASTKYANEAATVYSGATEDADTLGALTTADEVTVTGVTDNGYTQIEYNGETAYVDSAAIVDEQPEVPEAVSNTGSGANTTGSTSTGSTSSQERENVPEQITVCGKKLDYTAPDGADYERVGLPEDQYVYTKMKVDYNAGTSIAYYYGFTYSEVMNPDTVTDLDSHLLAVEDIQ